MTYNVFGGKLNLALSICFITYRCWACYIMCSVGQEHGTANIKCFIAVQIGWFKWHQCPASDTQLYWIDYCLIWRCSWLPLLIFRGQKVKNHDTICGQFVVLV